MRIFIVQVFCAWLLLTLSPVVVKDDTVVTTPLSTGNQTNCSNTALLVLVEARLHSLCHTRKSAAPIHTTILAESETECAEKKGDHLKIKRVAWELV